MTHPDDRFDFAALIDRCAQTRTSPSSRVPPEPAARPDAPGLLMAASDLERRRAEAVPPEHSARATAIIFPPHLFPPASAQPFYLRVFYHANWDGSDDITFPLGQYATRVLDWFVPRGHCYTTRTAFIDIVGNVSEVCAGFRVYRNDRLWFDGDEIVTDHGNGITSKLARLGHTGTYLNRSSLTATSDSSHTIDFPSTFLPGEKISIDFTKFSGDTKRKIAANIRIAGYLYPQEDL
jgi:hypothetical protein